MKKMTSILLISMAYLSCNGLADLKQAKSGAPENVTNVAQARHKPEEVIKAFLKWYKANQERLDQIHLLSGKPGGKQAYAVNFQETERYLKELKKSGLVSDVYLEHFREYFKKCDENLKRHPQYDGPAAGFGFDLVTGNQEYGVILDQIEQLKIESVNVEGNKARVKARINNYGHFIDVRATLTKSGNAWLIDVLKL